LQLLSHEAVAGHPEPSHCSPAAASIWPSPQKDRLAWSV
jgi:hypothetical protein